MIVVILSPRGICHWDYAEPDLCEVISGYSWGSLSAFPSWGSCGWGLEGFCPSSQLAFPWFRASLDSGILVVPLWFQNRVSPFKDMIFCFSQEDWSLLDPAQTGFYGEFIIGEDCGVSLPPSKTY